MKKFLPKSWDYLYDIKFINGYEIEDDSIVIYYDDKNIEIVPYSIEKENEILKTMKRQVEMARRIYPRLKQDIFNSKFLFAADSVGCLTCLLVANHTDHPAVQYTVAGLFALLATYFGVTSSREQGKTEEMKKYIYFDDNKDIINEEIIRVFNEEEDTEGYEPNTLGLNDLDGYTLKELQEMVDNIKKQNEGPKLVLK